MKLKQSLQNLQSRNSKGFTLVEIIVSMGLAAGLAVMVAGTVIVQKSLAKTDVKRSQANQDLRSLFDIIGTEIRLTGENLTADFPALELIDGANGDPDILILRRNLLDNSSVLYVCNSNLRNNNRSVVFSNWDDSNPGQDCDFNATKLDQFNAWLDYYNKEGGGVQRAFIYNSKHSSEGYLGEFFEFESVEIQTQSSGRSRYRLRTPANPGWAHTHRRNDGDRIYLLEEWRIELETSNNFLKLVNSGDTTNFFNLTSNIGDFQVLIHLKDGSIVNSCRRADECTNITGVEVLITSFYNSYGETIEKEWSSKSFPRNILPTIDP